MGAGSEMPGEEIVRRPTEEPSASVSGAILERFLQRRRFSRSVRPASPWEGASLAGCPGAASSAIGVLVISLMGGAEEAMGAEAEIDAPVSAESGHGPPIQRRGSHCACVASARGGHSLLLRLP